MELVAHRKVLTIISKVLQFSNSALKKSGKKKVDWTGLDWTGLQSSEGHFLGRVYMESSGVHMDSGGDCKVLIKNCVTSQIFTDK